MNLPLNQLMTFCLILLSGLLISQDQQARLSASLLGETPIEEDLRELCDEIGGRVTGSKSNLAAVEWGLQKFKEAGVNAWKQEFEMPSLWLEKSTKAKVTGDVNFHPIVVSKFYVP